MKLRHSLCVSPLRDGGRVFPKLLELVKHFLAADNLVDEVGVTLVLVLDHVVEHLESEGQVPVVLLVAHEALCIGEELKEVAEPQRRGHAESLDVGGDIAHDGQEALIQGLDLLRPVCYQLVDNDVREVRVVALELRQVDRELAREGSIEVDAEISLSRQEQHDEGADVDQPDLGGVLAALVHEVQHRNNEVVDVPRTQHVPQEGLVLVNKLPEQHEQLLEARNLLDRRREQRVVGLMRIIEQLAQPRHDKLKVLLFTQCTQRVPKRIARPQILCHGLGCIRNLLCCYLRAAALIPFPHHLLIGSLVVETHEEGVQGRVHHDLV
mmetsp:Transcript_41150/g.100973  ORF Transcript_41150/g.100973 Transcript_41150/m.100973 type:complete len:324 (-) Transcript_41150:281-1252(-)